MVITVWPPQTLTLISGSRNVITFPTLHKASFCPIGENNDITHFCGKVMQEKGAKASKVLAVCSGTDCLYQSWHNGTVEISLECAYRERGAGCDGSSVAGGCTGGSTVILP